jgi:hypothetical protein
LLELAIRDGARKITFSAQQKVTYPILLDRGRKVNEHFQNDGIPKTFVCDRNGKPAAQSIDMRTRGQFLEMLSQAGLKQDPIDCGRRGHRPDFTMIPHAPAPSDPGLRPKYLKCNSAGLY